MLEIIKELRRDNGKLYKERTLRKHSGNVEWRDYLRAVYNPFVTYGVSGDKNGGRDDLENLKLCRSIDAGITATTINKVYSGLIPTASKMMKAKDNCVNDISYPCFAGIKYDGHYTNVIVQDGLPRFYTSGGHEYTVRGEHPFVNVPDGVYLAERIGKAGKLGDRRYANLRGPKPIQYSINHTFKVFDRLTMGEFNNDKTIHGYSHRRRKWSVDWDINNFGYENLVYTRKELDVQMKMVTDQGYEGLVIKQPNMIWRNSTSRRLDFIKYKKRPSADLLCIAEMDGEGKFDGVIGALILQDSQGRQVSVGSGMSEPDRLRYGNYLGKVIEIEYEQIMDTYIQPVFVRVRLDKPTWDID